VWPSASRRTNHLVEGGPADLAEHVLELGRLLEIAEVRASDATEAILFGGFQG